MEGHQVNHESRLFGEELRRKRLTADLSLAQLAHIVHYSKAQLSKVERGIKTPSRDLARLCDAALEANGELASLASPGPASRRQVLAAGALATPAICLGGSAASGKAEHTDLVGIFRIQLDHYRKLGQTTDPAILIPVLAGQLTVIQEVAVHTGRRASQPLLIIASRYADYTGWLVQERGTDSGALRWTRQAGSSKTSSPL
jgi:transcriptional regulator with XRE-family HTH domain